MNPRAVNAIEAKMYMERLCVWSESLIIHETQFEIEKNSLPTLKKQKHQLCRAPMEEK
jgi:hypothetical protein